MLLPIKQLTSPNKSVSGKMFLFHEQTLRSKASSVKFSKLLFVFSSGTVNTPPLFLKRCLDHPHCSFKYATFLTVSSTSFCKSIYLCFNPPDIFPSLFVFGLRYFLLIVFACFLNLLLTITLLLKRLFHGIIFGRINFQEY